MQPEKDPIRVKAQEAAKAKLRSNPTEPDLALRAYLEVMIAGKIDANFPSSRPDTATRVTIEDARGGLLRAAVNRGSPQSEMCVGATLEGLIGRVNDKYFLGDNVPPVSVNGAKRDVIEAQRAVAVGTVVRAMR